MANTFNQEFSAPLSVKDLGIIQDSLHHEALAYKKCNVYAATLDDAQLRSMAQSQAEHHRQHFFALNDYLNSQK